LPTKLTHRWRRNLGTQRNSRSGNRPPCQKPHALGRRAGLETTRVQQARQGHRGRPLPFIPFARTQFVDPIFLAESRQAPRPGRLRGSAGWSMLALETYITLVYRHRMGDLVEFVVWAVSISGRRSPVPYRVSEEPHPFDSGSLLPVSSSPACFGPFVWDWEGLCRAVARSPVAAASCKIAIRTCGVSVSGELACLATCCAPRAASWPPGTLSSGTGRPNVRRSVPGLRAPPAARCT